MEFEYPQTGTACLSCGTVDTIQWYRPPWDTDSSNRICTNCYSIFTRVKVRCLDCNKVCSSETARKMFLQGKLINRNLSDGTIIKGYPCESCNGLVNEFKEEASKKKKGRDRLPTGLCYICKTTDSTCWRKIPWDPELEWCGLCRSRYDGTATICTNKLCLKIPSKEELKEMSVIDADAGLYSCLKCNSDAQKDMNKNCRTVKKAEATHGICNSCGPVTSKRWTRLPWNKKYPAQICRTCSSALRTHKARCLNDECGQIFGKHEVDRIKKLKKVSSPSGEKSRQCLKCKGPTTLIN